MFSLIPITLLSLQGLALYWVLRQMPRLSADRQIIARKLERLAARADALERASHRTDRHHDAPPLDCVAVLEWDAAAESPQSVSSAAAEPEPSYQGWRDSTTPCNHPNYYHGICLVCGASDSTQNPASPLP